MLITICCWRPKKWWESSHQLLRVGISMHAHNFKANASMHQVAASWQKWRGVSHGDRRVHSKNINSSSVVMIYAVHESIFITWWTLKIFTSKKIDSAASNIIPWWWWWFLHTVVFTQLVFCADFGVELAAGSLEGWSTSVLVAWTAMASCTLR